MDYALPILLIIPLLGAGVTALLPDGRPARSWAMFVAVATLLWAVRVFSGYDWADAGTIQFKSCHLESSLLGFGLRLGVDAPALVLIGLTVFLQPLAMASSFASIRDREKQYYAWMLLLLAFMLGVFMARDLLAFYVFFELTLVPMFFIIGIWGGQDRRQAAIRFFLFTFAGSIFTLAAIVYLGVQLNTFDLDLVIRGAASLPTNTRLWVLLGLLCGFAVKVPLFPVHTWLPLAHTEAPTAGSVILAGVLLKLGTYGIWRVAMPIGLLGPDGSVLFPAVLHGLAVLCLAGIVYGALVAWVQKDIKKLVAYSSVSHLGFCVLGLLAVNSVGTIGSLLYMVNHGLSTGAMFLVIGMIYDRFHTRDINAMSGLAARMPRLAFFFVLFSLSSIGLPGLNGFVSEFLSILGAFTSPHLGVAYGVVASLGIVLGAVYMLHLVACVVFGPLKVPGHAPVGHGDDASHDVADLGGREMAILVPLAAAVVVLGVWSAPVVRLLTPAVEKSLGTTLVQAGAKPASPSLAMGGSPK